jgi:hypothetical protein
LLHALLYLPVNAAEVDSQNKREAARNDGIVISQGTLDGYVGTYRISPAIALRIWREGEHLMLQATGQAAHRLIGESESVFHVRDMEAKVSFGFNAAGDADHLMLDQDGRSTKAIRE